MDPVRKLLLDLIAGRGSDLASVSRAIGKNHAYLQQFVKRGVPRHLPEDAREALGGHFGVDPNIFRSSGKSRRSTWSYDARRLDAGKLRRAMLVAESVVGPRSVEDRGSVVLEIASAVYDVLAEKEAEGKPITDDDEALRLIASVLRRIRMPPPPV